MPQLIWTQEQVNVFDTIFNTKGDVVVQARAGSSKTTVGVEAIRRILEKYEKASITFLSFNKHIQEEIKLKVSEDVFVYTTHGLGFGAICRKYGKVEINDYKVNLIASKLSRKWGRRNGDEEYLNKIVKLVGLCKLTISLKPNQISYIANKYLLPLDKDGDDLRRILKVLEMSALDTKTIDFDDMVYIPATDPKIWMYQQDYVFVDEAQDLSKAQHYMITKMLKRDKMKNVVGRIIAVGDPCQAIMGFSGSDSSSFDWFKQRDNAVILPLTHTFRCAKAIVREANTLVPDIKALEKAEEGIVREGNVLDEAQPGDFVLSRTGKPLVKLFFELFLRKKKAIVKGGDYGARILAATAKYEKKEEMLNDLNYHLGKYRMDLAEAGVTDIDKHYGYVDQRDFVETVDMIAKTITTMAQIKVRVREIFHDKPKEPSIILSTVHKIKGLETDRVFIILPQNLAVEQPLPWMTEQENNLKYVAITRAKKELIYDRTWTDGSEPKPKKD